MATSGRRRSFNADLDQLRTCFSELDAEDTGYIGYEQLRKLVQSLPDTEESVVPDLWEKLDRDKDGKVSFEDFTWLFQQERETKKKRPKLMLPQIPISAHANSSQRVDQSSAIMTSPPDSMYRTAMEDSEEFSPSSRVVETSAGPAVLRTNRRRATMPSRLHRPRGSSDFSMLSPIQLEKSPQKTSRPPSTDMPDLASQMKYLTESVDSPQLKRSSKVLSWIESGDALFEDTGTGLKGKEELPSPPVSPLNKTSDLEVSHVESVLEEVCNTDEFDKEAVLKLCRHVQAEPQEQQELLTLLSHIDKENRGFVSVTEFARGLQAIRNSAKVGTSTPARGSMRRYNSEMTPSRYKESFGSPLSQGIKPQLSSTPSMPRLVTQDHSFSFLDPKETGLVKIDDIVTHWQDMGVEAANDQDIEKIITESFAVDAGGRVSVSDMATSLESSVLTEGKPSSSVLRQAAVKSYKKEISTLKTHVHQVSMERDKLQASLNRTTEEKATVIKEGDEHVEMIMRNAERKTKEQKHRYQDELREKERAMREEIQQIQEQASHALKEQEEKYKILKRDEENIRQELKYVTEEKDAITKQLHAAQSKIKHLDKTIENLQKDLGSRSDNDLFVDEGQLSQLSELEAQLANKNACITELQDKHREINDNYDELKADHEKMKQKYYALKRKNYHKTKNQPLSQSMGASTRQRHPSADNRSRYLNRPLSGSHFHKRSRPINPRVATSMDLDLAVDHLLPEADEDGDDEDTDFGFASPRNRSSETDDTLDEMVDSDSEKDNFGKSTASLLEEIQDMDVDQNKLEEECRRNEEIIKKLKEEIFRLEETTESQQDQLLDMEEKNSNLSREIQEAQLTVESERKSHEVEVNILSRKIDNAERAAAELEIERNREEEDHRNSVTILSTKFAGEMQNLQTELEQVRASLTEQSEQQVAEIQTLKELLQKEQDQLLKTTESYTELGEKHSEEMEAIRYKLRVTVEELHEQLIKKEQDMESLEEKLKAKEHEYESLSSSLDTLHYNEEEHRSQISAFEEKEYKFKTSITRLEGEISQLLSSYSRQIASAKIELSRGVTSTCDSIQKQLDDLTSGCESKLNKAQRKFGKLVSCLKDQDLHHANAVKSLLFDLHQSQRDINTLKDEVDLLRSELENSHSELDKVRVARDALKDINMATEEEVEDLKSKLEQAKRRRPISLVEADSGQVITEQDDMQLRDSLILEKDSTIHALRNEVESLKNAEKHARVALEETNRKLHECRKELLQVKDKSEREVVDYESKIHELSNECKAQLEKVNQLNKTLQNANTDHQKSTTYLELQNAKAIEELKDKYLVEIDHVKDLVASNNLDARKLYSYVLEAGGKTAPQQVEYTHAQLMLESMKEIDYLKEQISRQREACNDLEALLEQKIEEHEILEAQFTAEHEEEVRALRQQKQHLIDQLTESKEHFENVLESQDEQNLSLKRELTDMKSEMDREIQHKTEEVYHIYQKVADLGEEKKVLMDIIKQLCMEAGRQIDIV